MAKKYQKRVENTVGKGEIARYEQFLLFPQCFLEACFLGASKGVTVWEWVNSSPVELKLLTTYTGRFHTYRTIPAFKDPEGECISHCVKGENADICKSISQSVGRSVSQSDGRSVTQSVSPSVGRSVGRSASQSASPLVSQSVNQSINPISQSIKRSINLCL